MACITHLLYHIFIFFQVVFERFLLFRAKFFKKIQASPKREACGSLSRSFLYARFGRRKGCCEDDAEECDDTLCDGADEKQDLRAGEGVSEYGNDIVAHKACERRTEHHAEEGCHIGDDGVEREIIRSVLVRQVEIRERRHDRARGNAENVLRKTNDDVEPNGIRRDEGIRVIRSGVDEKHDGERAEPIMLRYQSFPHLREEDEEEEIRCVDAVTEGIADADVLKNVRVERCVGEVEGKGISGGDEDRAEETLVFKGKREDIRKLRDRCLRVREFLGDEPDDAVNDGEGERDITNDRQHRELVGRARERVTDGGNDECEDIRKCAVDATCGIEIVYAHVVGQEVRVPCGKAGSEELVDGVCRDDEHDEPDEHLVGILDECRKQRDADDVDEIRQKLAGNKDPFSPFEALEDERGEDVQKAGDIGDEGQDTDAGFIEPVL